MGGADVLVRPFVSKDREAILALVPRLVAGVAPYRDPEGVRASVVEWVRDSIDAVNGAEGKAAVFVAESNGGLSGFVSVEVRGHWSGGQDAYVGELVVAPGAVRTGVGRLLMSEAEEWARNRGLARLSLETGADNQTARTFYAAGGYVEEEVRLSKALESPSTCVDPIA
ncbi:MAG: GNAT family N-acetyltransferase [Candidatus Nanopelagicales bacterium]